MMKQLIIYDAAMCCDTGVCGADADTVLISFASDIDWLKKNGADVQRFNLAQEPAAFVENPLVRTEINEAGESCLPLLLLEGEIISRGVYPDRRQLQAWMGMPLSEGSAAATTSRQSSACRDSGPSSCCG
jgi:hypothetical protein